MTRGCSSGVRRGGRLSAVVLAARLGGAGLALALCGLPLGTAQAQGRAGAETEEEKVFSEAEALFNNGNYDDAAPLYDKAIGLNPTRPASFVKRATIYFRARQYDRAIERLQQAERLAPDDLNLKTVLGLCLYQSGRQKDGLRYLEDVAARRPEAYEAQLQIGQHYAHLDPARATVALDTYFRYRPDDQRSLDGGAWLFRGTAYYLTGRLPEAQRDLEEAAAARPRDAQARLLLGAVLLSRGDYQGAVRAHEPYAAEAPRRPRVAFNLAQGYLRLGRQADAQRLAERYTALRPQDPRGHVLLGDVSLLGRESDPKTALRHYEEAGRLSRRPTGERPAVSIEARKARAYLMSRDPDRAIAFAETALLGARGPEGARPGEEEDLLTVLLEAELSRLQAGGNTRPQLLELASRLVALLPRDAGALALAGSVALGVGNAERARRYYSEALALDPRLRRARLGMARTLSRLAVALVAAGTGAGEGPGAALPLLEQALPYDDTPTTAKNLAVTYLLLNRPADAERVLAPLLSGAGRTDPGSLRLHGRALLMLSRPGPALVAYERAALEAAQQLQGIGDKDGRASAMGQLGELHVELGARYLGLGRLDEAIDVLDRAGRELPPADDDGDGGLRRAALRDLSLSYLLRGRGRLTEGEALLRQNPQGATRLFESALDDLQKALERGGLQPGRRETGTALCAAAMAAVQATKYGLSRELLGKANDEGGCEMAPPFDRLGTELLMAYISYRDTGSTMQRERALRTLTKLAGRIGSAGGAQPLSVLLRALSRSTHEMLAYDYYATGKGPRAAQLLRAAQRLPQDSTGGKAAEAEADVLAHNLAVVELSEGKPAGEKVLERLGMRPPEALVNLGILRDRRGEPKKALELYRRALERGAHAPKLREWIDVKDRLFGEGQEGK